MDVFGVQMSQFEGLIFYSLGTAAIGFFLVCLNLLIRDILRHFRISYGGSVNGIYYRSPNLETGFVWRTIHGEWVFRPYIGHVRGGKIRRKS